MNLTPSPTHACTHLSPAGTAKLEHQARAQRSGGPLDSALYRCSCGHCFQAPVSTTVPCPRCGQGQAW